MLALLLCLISCVIELLCRTVSGAGRTHQTDRSHLPHLSLPLLSDQINNKTAAAGKCFPLGQINLFAPAAVF